MTVLGVESSHPFQSEHLALWLDVIGADGRIRWANPAQHAALGQPAGALAGRRLEEVYSAESARVLRHVLRAGTPALPTLELGLLGADGALLRVAATAAGERGRDGRSELHLAKVPLGAIEQRLSSLEQGLALSDGIIEQASEGHWCIEYLEPVDLDQPEEEVLRQVFAHRSYWRVFNRAMARVYGLPPDTDLTERHVRLYWPRSPENETFVRRLIRHRFCLDHAVSVDRRHDGTPIVVDNDVRADIDGAQLLRLWGNVREHRPTADTPFAALEHSAEPLLAVDAAQHLLWRNAAAARLCAGLDERAMRAWVKPIAEHGQGVVVLPDGSGGLHTWQGLATTLALPAGPATLLLLHRLASAD